MPNLKYLSFPLFFNALATHSSLIYSKFIEYFGIYFPVQIHSWEKITLKVSILPWRSKTLFREHHKTKKTADAILHLLFFLKVFVD